MFGALVVSFHCRFGTIQGHTFLPFNSSCVLFLTNCYRYGHRRSHFSYLYDPNVGLFNTILTFFGFPRLYYLDEPSTALPSLFVVNVWLYLGFDAVIFLTALQNVPQDVYDSARVDGANSWQRMLHITLPLIKPVGLFLLITTFVGSFQIFSLVWMLTPDGGPLNSTTVLMFYIYETAFERYKINYACALTYIMFVITLAITMFQLKIGKSSWQY